MKSFMPTPQDNDSKWLVVDATDKVLGRLATEVAIRLRGKHKPEYTPHADNGDFVIVLNADKIRVTGAKLTDKMYYHHTGFPGGIKSISLEKQMKKDSTAVIMSAVKGMLPKNSLGRSILTKLKVYAGNEHPHQAQNPKPLEI